jgi:hypothetical protein
MSMADETHTVRGRAYKMMNLPVVRSSARTASLRRLAQRHPAPPLQTSVRANGQSVKVLTPRRLSRSRSTSLHLTCRHPMPRRHGPRTAIACRVQCASGERERITMEWINNKSLQGEKRKKRREMKRKKESKGKKGRKRKCMISFLEIAISKLH